MPVGSRHVWIQADDLDAQGTIIVPVCLNEPLIYSNVRSSSLVKGHIQSALPASCLFHRINCAPLSSSPSARQRLHTSAQTWTFRHCPRQTPSCQRTRFRPRWQRVTSSLTRSSASSFKLPRALHSMWRPLIGRAGLPIVSVDIPSGWDVERGDASELGVPALHLDVLVSLTAPKEGVRKFTGATSLVDDSCPK